MTIPGVSSLQPQNLFSILTRSGSDKTSNKTAATPQDPAPQLSVVGDFLSSLQKLQQQDPARFQQVSQNIATRLQHGAVQAGNQGDTVRATALNKLASDFQNASKTGQMPSTSQLQVDASAVTHGHRGHHHGHVHPADSQVGSTPNPYTASSTDLLSSLLTGTAGS